MAKVTGITQRLFVNQYDLSGDVGALDTAQHARNQQDVTVLTDAALERLGLLRDGHMSFTAFFDTDPGQEHPVLKGLPQSALFTWLMGITLGSPTCSLVANTTDYPITRGADGSLVLKPTADANGFGLQWGNLLTAGIQTFASAAATTGVDDYVPSFPTLALPSTWGLAAYLHVISLGSGTAVVHLQDSTDNLSFSDLTGGAFTNVTGATSQRIQTSPTQAINRYLRVNVSGTFTNLVAVVSAIRYVNQFVS